jgi:hypothetical protein
MTKAPDYEIVECEGCHAEVLSTKMHEHHEVVHRCAICGQLRMNLESHIEFAHRDETDRVREDAHDA